MDNPSSYSPFADNESKAQVLTDDDRKGDVSENHLGILPLRYWGVTLVLVVFFIGGISGWQSIFQRHVDVPPAIEYNIDRMTEPGEGMRVVALGDSYIRYAFPIDDRLDKIAGERGLSIKFTRFTKNLGKARHFAVLLPHILAAKPEVVILEAGPFIVEPRRTGLNLLASFRKGIRNIKLKIEGRKEGRLFLENSEGEADKTEDWTSKPEMVKNRIEEKKQRSVFSNPDMPDAYEEFFKAAQAQGTKVVLLDLGHSKVLNEALSTDFKNQISSRLDYWESRYPIEIWHFPSNLPLTHYTDIAHLNINGQRVFSQWLLDRLVMEGKKND